MTPADEVIARQVPPAPGRLEPRPGAPTMRAVVTTAAGGLDRLEVRDVAVPEPGDGEVLLRVLAAGLNNTDINTRVGWYASAVTGGTDAASADRERGATRTSNADGGWAGATPFPLIQGVDCCGRVERLGPGVDAGLAGRRVLVRPVMRPQGFRSPVSLWLGVDMDGAFAEFVRVPVSEVVPVESDWTDVELGSVPCAFGTAENMLQRAGVQAGEHVLVTGASGGVGSAAVQLAVARGARVTAVASVAKASGLVALGAERVIERDADTVAALGSRSVDVVVDLVSGPGLDRLVGTLRAGGRYATAGAIGGPMVTFDKRDLYLRDLTFFGCTAWDEPVFPAVVAAVVAHRVRPLVAATFPLERLAEAEEAFLAKRHLGKIVVVPTS